ncbi:CG6404 [Drosophila busckii]|uniref:CG6404 n=2 Tax=Drosophila busckii TaxID=30019 RepID=A0A0M4EZG5_DROBS|nr:CG6404 [Drosophila busckii]
MNSTSLQASKAASQMCTSGHSRRDMHLTSSWSSQLNRRAGAIAPPTLLPLYSSAGTLRYASSGTEQMPESVSTKELVELPDIPEAPMPPAATGLDNMSQQLIDAVNLAGEPSFASIGLGGWSPVGMVQNCMEFVHCTWDIPWWGTIAIGTAIVRTIIFPLVILAQRNSAKMNNNMPQMQLLQMKMTEARQSGNALESARYAQEMMVFMKEKGVNPLKNMIVPLAQAPLFISFFMGLRQMANTPVDSMRDGGLFWFTDLTMADPFYILPVITSATLYLTIEIGTDSARLSAANMNTMKYVLRALPLVIFPFTMNFPAAILTYWACSNFISLGQVALLRVPAVRDYFKIEKLLTHAPSSLPKKKKGFVGGMKESWENMKITKEIEERQRLDEIRFAKAGKGPLVKTYKYDPTKPRTHTDQITSNLEKSSKDK